MLTDIVEVKPLANKTLYIKFEDGLEGKVKIDELTKFEGIFEPLKNPCYFEQVSINKETGTIYWPNLADICSDVLYAKLSGKTIEEMIGIDVAS